MTIAKKNELPLKPRFGDSWIPWEADEGETPVQYKDSQARIIATVSPNEKRFHEFREYAKVLIDGTHISKLWKGVGVHPTV